MSPWGVAAVAVAVATGAGWAQNVAAPGAGHFRLEWEVGKGRKGHPIVSGYLYNDYGLPSVRVQLLVEGLDAAGQTVNETVAYIDSEVPPKGRAYFEVAVPKRGPAYRVTVYFFDWPVRPLVMV